MALLMRMRGGILLLLVAFVALSGCVPGGRATDEDGLITVPLGDAPSPEVATGAEGRGDDPAQDAADTAAAPADETPEPDPELIPAPTPVPPPLALPEEAPQPQADPEPILQARARAACTEQGGIFTRRSAGVFACVQTTRDANRQCRQNSDCESACLARSGTCAPFRPLYGCHEVLSGPGRPERVCLE